LDAEIAGCVRDSSTLGIIVCDIDGFRQINDRYGSLAGDQLIRAAANLLRGHARGADRLARVGGDEFLILMPETDLDGARRYLARVRSAIRRIQANEVAALQLSFGAATARGGESLASVIGRSDAAMYAAKKRRVRKAKSAR